MRVRFKRGWWRTYGTLTPSNVYRVIGIECDSLRIIDDLGEPVLFEPHAFVIVDANEPSDWISERGSDGERYTYPAEFAKPGFFEDWHDGVHAVRSRLTAYMRRICWEEAEALEESANTYLRVRWKHERSDGLSMSYSELDEERYEVRRVNVFVDGRVGYADGRRESVETTLGEAAVPPFDEIAANPEVEPFTISRAEFETVWHDAAYRNADD